MRVQDIRVGMWFHTPDLCSFYFRIDALDEDAKGRFALVEAHTCWTGGPEKIYLADIIRDQALSIHDSVISLLGIERRHEMPRPVGEFVEYMKRPGVQKRYKELLAEMEELSAKADERADRKQGAAGR